MMGVYEDMANDAGCPYGTDENRQMAEMLYAQEVQSYQEHCKVMELLSTSWQRKHCRMEGCNE